MAREELRIPHNRDLPPNRLQMRKDHLVNEVAREGSSLRSRSTWRVLVLTAMGAVISVAVGAVAASTWTQRPELAVAFVACHESASPSSDAVAVDNSMGYDPRDLCRGFSGNNGSRADFLACAVGGGLAGPVSVFPSMDGATCQSMGLEEVSDGYRAAAAAFGQLRSAITDRLGFKAPCLTEAEARQVIRQELDSREFSDWSVEVRGQRTGDFAPCGLLGFDLERRVVILEPGSQMGR